MISRPAKVSSSRKQLPRPSLNSRLLLPREILTAELLLMPPELDSRPSSMVDSLPGKSSTTRRLSTPSGKRTHTTDSLSSDSSQRNRPPSTRLLLRPTLLSKLTSLQGRPKKLISTLLRDLNSKSSSVPLDKPSSTMLLPTMLRWQTSSRLEETPSTLSSTTRWPNSLPPWKKIKQR